MKWRRGAAATPKKLIDGFNGAVSISARRENVCFARTSLTMPAKYFGG